MWGGIITQDNQVLVDNNRIAHESMKTHNTPPPKKNQENKNRHKQQQ